MDEIIKERFAKGLIVFTGILAVFSMFGFPIITTCLGYTLEQTEKLWFTLIVIAMVTCAFMMITLSVVGLDRKPTKPDTILAEYNTYDAFLTKLHDTLLNRGYSKIGTSVDHTTVGVELYINTSKLTIDGYAVIRCSELYDDAVERADKMITSIMEKNKHTQYSMRQVNMTSIFCVDRITPAFRKLINHGVQQEYMRGRFIVGLSFGGNKFYIANPADSFAFMRYKQLRKSFTEKVIDKTGDGLREPF